MTRVKAASKSWAGLIERARHSRMPRSRSVPTHPAVGLHAQTVLLDLCSGQNRFGAPAAVLHAANEALLAARPEAVLERARDAVAERFGVAASHVLLGPGVNGLLPSVASALVTHGDTWLSVEPSITGFAAAARAAGARVTQWRAVERRGHRVELDQVAELARLVEPKVVSMSAPADPSGTSIPYASIVALAAELQSSVLVVDQSWLSLSSDHADLELPPPANVVCLRSLSVEMGLSGLRAGYALCAPELAARIADRQPPLAASAPAAAAITAALHETEHIARCRSQLLADGAALQQLLAALSLTYAPSITSFALVRIDRAGEVAEELRREHAIAVYDATRVGLPDHLRIVAPAANSGEHSKLKTALEQVLERRGLKAGREA